MVHSGFPDGVHTRARASLTCARHEEIESAHRASLSVHRRVVVEAHVEGLQRRGIVHHKERRVLGEVAAQVLLVRAVEILSPQRRWYGKPALLLLLRTRQRIS